MAERDEVMHQLAKIQSDRQEAISNSQALNSKFESTNREVGDLCGSTYTACQLKSVYCGHSVSRPPSAIGHSNEPL